MKTKSHGYNEDVGLNHKSVTGQGIALPSVKTVMKDKVGVQPSKHYSLPVFNHSVKDKHRKVRDVLDEIKEDTPKPIKKVMETGIKVPKAERYLQDDLERDREEDAKPSEKDNTGQYKVDKLNAK
jgi:hypothetical protein